MDPASTLFRTFAVFILVAVNAYFVAAEFALVAVRRTRIEQLARAGDRRARAVLNALDHPDDFISAAQLGITAASIGIGYIAESTLHRLLFPLVERMDLSLFGSPGAAAHVIATVLTLLIVTYLHVVLGEQVPKMVAIQRAEATVLWTTGPTRAFGRLFRPFIRLMSGSAGLVMRGFGMRPTGVHPLAHTPEEIRLLVEQSTEEGMVELDQEQMIQGVFEFRDTLAREIMTPRPDIIALPVDARREEVLRLVLEEGHSRIPVYEDTLDEIVGVLLVKDLLAHVAAGREEFDLRSLVRDPYFVPDTKPLGALMEELRARSQHMAIILDEFGGTEGLVTLEDMIEEIVGEIRDEYDVPEPEDFADTAEGDVLIDGGASIFEVNERLGLALPEEDFDTIGGYIFGELGRVPITGDEVALNGAGRLRVEEIEERRVTRVRWVAPPEPNRGAVHAAPEEGA